MATIFAIVISIALFVAPVTSGATDQLRGTYRGSFDIGGKSSTLELMCASETSCVLVTKADGMEPHAALLEKITPVAPTAAGRAFEYARNRNLDTIANDEYAALHALLRPVLQSKAKVSTCWDLNYPQAQYSLVCMVDKAPFLDGQIYVFFALLAPCSQGFCGYVIQSLDRQL